MMILTDEGKQELAVALILLQDFKTDGIFDVEVCQQIHKLAMYLNIEKEYNAVRSLVPPMKIIPRYAEPNDV